MAVNKYNKDYRLHEEFLANGKIRMRSEYIGSPYYFKCGADKVHTEKKRALLLILAAGAAFIAALIPYSEAMHRLWVALPFAFSVLPIFLTGDLVVSMQKWTEPMEHRQADKLNNKYPPVTLAVMYLEAVSLIADAVFLVMNGAHTAGDFVLPACMAFILACGFLLFRKRTSFAAEAGSGRAAKTK